MTERQHETEERERNEALDNLRAVIARGIGAAQAAAYEEYAADLSLVNVIAEAIVKIEDDESDIRPGKISALRNLKQEVTTAVERAIDFPPELFALDTGEDGENE